MKKILPVTEAIFLCFVFFLANIRSIKFWSLYPPTETISEPAWREVFIWLFALGLLLYLLAKNDLYKIQLTAMRNQPLLIVFILFSLFSILWSEAWTVTLHRSLVFVFAAISAVYIGVRYSLGEFLQTLFALGVVVLTASFILILADPSLGTAQGYPYYGAWRGIFWHKNQFGNIIPIFTLVFLTRLSSPGTGTGYAKKLIQAIFYILSLIAVFFSKSAAGYILLVIIHFFFGLAFVWLKFRTFIRPVYYYLALTVFIVGAVGIALNLDFVLGLFNRSASFTGRVPLWIILLRDVYSHKPWFGYGFGTIWADVNFRTQVRDWVKWSFPVMIGDNGFLDILLNLGLVGFVLFLANYIRAWIGSVRIFQKDLTLESFFPILFMIYTFFANITYSLFMETEVFVWMLIVTLMVIMAQKNNNIPSIQQGAS
ncbi:MAG: O-antigen ligase family protein [Chloroflexi bacterium]|nr:O-antigen ligase family protein [Chloroflexota bacterium]